MKRIIALVFATFAIITLNANSLRLNNEASIKVLLFKQATLQEIILQSTPIENSKQHQTKATMVLLPLAGTKNIKILFTAEKAVPATILVLDNTGKKVLTQNTQLTKGDNNITIKNFDSLNEGAFSIQLICADATHTSSFLLWK